MRIARVQTGMQGQKGKKRLESAGQNDFEWPPLCFGHLQRKNYFYIEQYRSVCGRSGIAFFTGKAVKANGIYRVIVSSQLFSPVFLRGLCRACGS